MGGNSQDELLKNVLDHEEKDDKHNAIFLSLTNELKGKLKIEEMKKIIDEKTNCWFKRNLGLLVEAVVVVDINP